MESLIVAAPITCRYKFEMITLLFLIFAGQVTCDSDGYFLVDVPDDPYYKYTTQAINPTEAIPSTVSSNDNTPSTKDDHTSAKDNTDYIRTDNDHIKEKGTNNLDKTKINSFTETFVEYHPTSASDIYNETKEQPTTSKIINDIGETTQIDSSIESQVDNGVTSAVSDIYDTTEQPTISKTINDIGETSQIDFSSKAEVENGTTRAVSDVHDKIADKDSHITTSIQTAQTKKIDSIAKIEEKNGASSDIRDKIMDQSTNFTTSTVTNNVETIKIDPNVTLILVEDDTSSGTVNENTGQNPLLKTGINTNKDTTKVDAFSGAQNSVISTQTTHVQENKEENTSNTASDTDHVHQERAKPFHVYWNVPTMQCKSKRIPFNKLFEKYGIIQNTDDVFNGDKVNILYHPGFVPHPKYNETTGELVSVNGAVPQEGDLNMHLKQFRKDLEKYIPDKNFNGIGIIDFEKWRPTFRQQFGTYVHVKDLSLKYETLRYMQHKTEKEIYESAKGRFEKAARAFMEMSLMEASKMRPRALWGYYAYPYCFNMYSDKAENCSHKTRKDNDMINWLWAKSSALYPSFYLDKTFTPSEVASFVRGGLAEAVRVKVPGTPVLPYITYQYRNTHIYLKQTHLDALLDTIFKSGANGTVIWGSSDDVDTPDKCRNLLKYTTEILGPAIAKYTKVNIRNIDDEDKVSDNKTVSEDKRTNDTQEVEYRKDFSVYWNMPTQQCKSKNTPFDSLYDKYGIIQNGEDQFRGDKITLLYSPGLFPHLANSKTGETIYVNGGVPQRGDLQEHLKKFRKDVEDMIPDKNFTGISVIAFTGWRPVFSQLYADFAPLVNISYEIESKLHESDDERKTEEEIKAEASANFEKSAKMFMQATLLTAKKMRPLARWGFQYYPLCFNMAPSNNMAEDCSDTSIIANDMTDWLWSQSSALYPWLNLSKDLTSYQVKGLIRGHVAEAARVKRKGTPVLPYIKFKQLLNMTDLNIILETLYRSEASGFIIWGFSSDFDTAAKCKELFEYTTKVLGPAIAKYTKVNTKNIDDKAGSSNKSTILEHPTTDNNEIKQITPKEIKVNITDDAAKSETYKTTNKMSAYDLVTLGSKHSTYNEDKFTFTIATNISLAIKEIRPTPETSPNNFTHDNTQNACVSLDSNTVQNILSEIKSLRQDMAKLQSHIAIRFDDLTHTILNRYDATLKYLDEKKNQNTLFYEKITTLQQLFNKAFSQALGELSPQNTTLTKSEG